MWKQSEGLKGLQAAYQLQQVQSHEQHGQEVVQQQGRKLAAGWAEAGRPELAGTVGLAVGQQTLGLAVNLHVINDRRLQEDSLAAATGDKEGSVGDNTTATTGGATRCDVDGMLDAALQAAHSRCGIDGTSTDMTASNTGDPSSCSSVNERFSSGSMHSASRTCLLLAMQQHLAKEITDVEHQQLVSRYGSEMLVWQQMQCQPGYTGDLCGTCMPALTPEAAASVFKSTGVPLSEEEVRGYGRLRFRCVACRRFSTEVAVMVVVFLAQCLYIAVGVVLQVKAPRKVLQGRGASEFPMHHSGTGQGGANMSAADPKQQLLEQQSTMQRSTWQRWKGALFAKRGKQVAGREGRAQATVSNDSNEQQATDRGGPIASQPVKGMRPLLQRYSSASSVSVQSEGFFSSASGPPNPKTSPRGDKIPVTPTAAAAATSASILPSAFQWPLSAPEIAPAGPVSYDGSALSAAPAKVSVGTSAVAEDDVEVGLTRQAAFKRVLTPHVAGNAAFSAHLSRRFTEASQPQDGVLEGGSRREVEGTHEGSTDTDGEASCTDDGANVRGGSGRIVSKRGHKSKMMPVATLVGIWKIITSYIQVCTRAPFELLGCNVQVNVILQLVDWYFQVQ
jgi:hypothetical protein